jgi:Zn-dependent protease
MYAPEPGQSRLDLRWRMFGVPVRVHPLFWVAAAALGWGFYAEPDRGNLGLFLLWTLCLLVSLLVHELGHVCAGRLFGAHLQVILYVLGGRAVGVESLKRRGQRVAVLLAGPLAQGLLLAGLWAVTSGGLPFPALLRERPWAAELVANGLYMLFLINLTWLLLNLVPLWPLDGGLISRELCEALFGPRGRAVALGACLFVPGLLALRIGQRVQALLPSRYQPRVGVELQMDGILLIFCAAFIGSGFRALRSERRRSV